MSSAASSFSQKKRAKLLKRFANNVAKRHRKQSHKSKGSGRATSPAAAAAVAKSVVYNSDIVEVMRHVPAPAAATASAAAAPPKRMRPRRARGAVAVPGQSVARFSAAVLPEQVPARPPRSATDEAVNAMNKNLRLFDDQGQQVKFKAVRMSFGQVRNLKSRYNVEVARSL